MDQARQGHWERVYAEKPPQTVSWFQEDPAPSLEMIAAAGAGPAARVIDVGAGASILVDRLAALDYRHLTALDISSRVLDLARARLGDGGNAVTWLTRDVTAWTPDVGAYDLWHDRAVFHFLTAAEGRAAYIRALQTGLTPGGWLVIATFAPTGPESCSGLPVQRYSADELQSTLGPAFQLRRHSAQTHLTPLGRPQAFTWCLFQRAAP